MASAVFNLFRLLPIFKILVFSNVALTHVEADMRRYGKDSNLIKNCSPTNGISFADLEIMQSNGNFSDDEFSTFVQENINYVTSVDVGFCEFSLKDDPTWSLKIEGICSDDHKKCTGATYFMKEKCRQTMRCSGNASNLKEENVIERLYSSCDNVKRHKTFRECHIFCGLNEFSADYELDDNCARIEIPDHMVGGEYASHYAVHEL